MCGAAEFDERYEILKNGSMENIPLQISATQELELGNSKLSKSDGSSLSL